MRTELVGIFRGQSFATADGEEFTVVELDAKSGYAVVETLEDEQGIMDLGAMLEAIHKGVLVNIDEKGDEGIDT
jgi:hypothetical protein